MLERVIGGIVQNRIGLDGRRRRLVAVGGFIGGYPVIRVVLSALASLPGCGVSLSRGSPVVSLLRSSTTGFGL